MIPQIQPKTEIHSRYNTNTVRTGAALLGTLGVLASQVTGATASVIPTETSSEAAFTAVCIYGGLTYNSVTIPLTNATFTNIFVPYVNTQWRGCDLIAQLANHGPDLSTFTFQVSSAVISAAVPVVTSLALAALHMFG